MLTSNEIRTVSFDKAMRGYRCEDVDAFLRQIADQMDQQNAKCAEMEKNLYVLAQKIEQYRADEDTLKSALINAQRLGENVIHEAKQKADSILRDAALKAESLDEQLKAKIVEQQTELERVQNEVAHFKASVLSLYKIHIESLSTLPDSEPEEEAPVVEPEETAQQEPEEEIELPAVEDEGIDIELPEDDPQPEFSQEQQ
ncbi:MAG TPA: DivIVA domain-containing protein [Candidatus Anaerofilum faecale]|nr:DivIVA domain-containing protein [Anaerofilum sp. An201]HIX12430.1 DivIVA domain-containing protein [Candidatus Anaerofilum faecale]